MCNWSLFQSSSRTEEAPVLPDHEYPATDRNVNQKKYDDEDDGERFAEFATERLNRLRLRPIRALSNVPIKSGHRRRHQHAEVSNHGQRERDADQREEDAKYPALRCLRCYVTVTLSESCKRARVIKMLFPCDMQALA